MASELSITISAVDKATAVINAVRSGVSGAMDSIRDGATKFSDSIKSAFSSLAENFASVHFLIQDAAMLIGKAFESIERYAGFVEVREQLDLMAAKFNTTADAIVGSMKRVSDGQISIEEATKLAAAALKNSLTPEQITGLTQAAIAFNDVAGVSVPEAFSKLADAVQKGSARGAVAIVGKDGLGDAMKELAKGTDDAGKSAALYQAIMAKTAEQMKLTGDAAWSLADKIDQTKVKWQDLTLKLSGFLTSGAFALAGVFYGIAAALSRVAAGATAAYASLQQLQFNTEGARESFQAAKDLWGSATELSQQADEYMKLAGATAMANAGMRSYTESVTSAGQAAVAAAPAIEQLGLNVTGFDLAAAEAKWKLINGVWTEVAPAATQAAAATKSATEGMKNSIELVNGVWTNLNTKLVTATTEIQDFSKAAKEVPKEIGITVRTKYVEERVVNNSGGPAASPTPAPTVQTGETSFSNGWGGMYPVQAMEPAR